MKAVRMHGERDLRLEDIAEPEVPAGSVRLEGGYSGICGSDLHLFYAPQAFPWDFSAPAPLTGAVWPQVLGHEFSGRVAELGAGVTGLAVGDAVAVFPYHVCGTCSSCNAGDPTGCELMAFEGIQGKSGGMATSSVVDASACFKLPDGVDLRLGALVEPMSVAWHGVSIAEVGQHEVAVVIGGGPIGVGTYFALVAAGVRQIVVSEPSEERRAILQRLGVQHVVDPITEDLAEVVSALSSGDGAGAVIDCAGSPRAFAGAMSVLGRNGRMVIVAAYESPIEFDTTLLRGGRSVRSSAVYTRDDFAAVIEAMGRGVYRTEGGWIDIVPFEGVQAAIESLRAGRGMKVLVETP